MHCTCWRQYLNMCFGQLTHRESLSDTILCIKANSNKLFHIGIGDAIAKVHYQLPMKIETGDFSLTLLGY